MDVFSHLNAVLAKAFKSLRVEYKGERAESTL